MFRQAAILSPLHLPLNIRKHFAVEITILEIPVKFAPDKIKGLNNFFIMSASILFGINRIIGVGWIRGLK